MLRRRPSILMFLVCIALIQSVVIPINAQSGQSALDIDFNDYVGIYENPDSTCVVLFAEKKALIVQRNDGFKFEIIPETSSIFHVKAFPTIKVVFTLDEQSVATGYTLVKLVIPCELI